MGITQGRVSAIEHAKPGSTELRTLATCVEALGGRLEIIADFGAPRSPSPNLAPKQPDSGHPPPITRTQPSESKSC